MSASNQDTYEVAFHRDVRIPTSDPAVTLGADLYLPDGTGPTPLLVMVLPYRKDLGGADLLLRYFARRGYAGLIVDVRGTGSSDGVARPPFSDDEAQDAVDAIVWGAEQPWCDGKVGMFGHSYGAMLTMRAAARRPGPLKAIIPIQGLVDPEVDLVHPDHARGGFAPATWMAGMVGNFLLPPMHAHDDEAATQRWRRRLETDEPHVLDLARLGPGDQRWRDRVLDASRIEVPALCFAGWRDLFADGQVRAYEAMTGPKRLVAGPWMHVLPVVSTEGALDFFGLCMRWWDRWLKDIDNGADADPSAVFVQGPEPYWTALHSWPDQRLTARPTGKESSDIPLEITSTVATSDPTVGVLSGLTRLPFAGFGMPGDQHDDDLRSACWTSQPLEDSVRILGRVEVTLDPPASGRVVVKLTHVDPAGRSLLITSGCTGEGRSEDAVKVTLDATGYEVPAGHRIRIVMSEADFPRLWPAPGHVLTPPGLAAVSLPLLRSSDVRPVDLPEEPAYLAGMLSAAAEAARPTWTLTRDMVRGSLAMKIDTQTSSHLPDRDLTIDSSSSAVMSASTAGTATITTAARWSIRGTAHPEVTVDVATETSDAVVTVTGRVTTGADVTFEQTWLVNTAAPSHQTEGTP